MRILQKAGRLLRDKKGQAFPLAVALSLGCLILLCGLSEYIRLMVIAAGVRDALQASVISAANDNYDDVFHGVREGYSGGYRPTAEDWYESLDASDVYGNLSSVLGLRTDGERYYKFAGDAREFTLSGLTVDIQNVPFAYGRTEENFLAGASICLEVPVRFGSSLLPPMRLTVRTRARYMPKF